MPGVTIGDDVIVGAGSVVTRDLDSNSVYAGVPARRLSSIEEYISRMRSKLDETVSFDSTYVVDVASQDAIKELVDTVHSMGGSGFIE